MKIKKQDTVIQFLISIVFIIIWEVIGRSSSNIFFVIGTPSAIFKEFTTLILKDNFHIHFFTTGFESICGLLIGSSLGSLFGLLLWYSKRITEISRPFIIAVGTLPVFAFAPLLIVWFGIGLGMKVALAAFSTVFVAFNQANKGANLVSNEYIDTLKGMNASKHQIFFKVIVPGSIDWVLSSMRLNVGFALLGAFVGEFIASDKGLGFLILRAGGLYNVPRAFAAAIGIIILALLLDYAARTVEKHSHILVQYISVPKVLRKKKY
ncbi:MAG TPA: ABC transporter permease subunit [Bacteroidia bacterium]|nr:ABC transporter permease subunit [Bacteroidia bacterium]